MDGSNAAQVAYWNDRAADTWTALQERLDRSFADITALILARAAAAPGERVLDVGCGCGDTTLALARAVAPGGAVLGVDVSRPMAARARARAEDAGLGHVRLEVDDAATHAFAPASVDLVASRFGVMFFADPAAAFANLRRAVRPGGRLAFVCWRAMALNRWMAAPFEAAAPLLPPPPPADPGAPGPFAFADAGRIREILAAAGWTEVAVDPADTQVTTAPPGEPDTALDYALRMGPLGRALAEAPADTRGRVEAAVAAALEPFHTETGTVLPAAVWLVSARA